MPELVVAYETWGTLAPDANNAILLCHGYTNHPHASGDADGWCSSLVGPGQAVDTDKYFVVCPNALGSAYGTLLIVKFAGGTLLMGCAAVNKT